MGYVKHIKNGPMKLPAALGSQLAGVPKPDSGPAGSGARMTAVQTRILRRQNGKA